MTSRGIACGVSDKCGLTPYVAIWVNGVSAQAMAPFQPKTSTCRRHLAMLVEHAVSRGRDVRVIPLRKGTEQ